MDRKSIIGIILIAIIFIVWGKLNQPNKEELQRAKQRQDSIALVKQQQNVLMATPDTVTVKKDSLSADSATIAIKANRMGDFGKKAYGEQKFYTIENDLLKLKVSSKGGRPYSVELKKFKTYDSLPLLLFNGDSTVFNINFYDSKRNNIYTGDLFFSADSTKPSNIIVKENADSLIMRVASSENKYIEYVYKVVPGSYKVDMDIRVVGLSDKNDQSGFDYVTLNWVIFSPQQEQGWKNESIYTSLYYKPYGEDVNYLRNTKTTEEEINTKLEWVAYKDQFFSSVLMADNTFLNAKLESINEETDTKFIKNFKSEIALPYNPRTDNTIGLSFYFGPNDFKLLKKQFGDKKLQDLIVVGRSIIKWINQGIIINLFYLLSKWFSSYGLIILLMTIIIKVALLPLTYKSYMSTAKMKVLKPMIDEITKKIPKEKAMERQQASMAVYKKVGVSPLGGCLPMLLQMPILFAMFRFFPVSIDLRQQSFLWATDLSTYDSIYSWSVNIPILSSIYGNHISLFTILMTVTTLLSMKMSGTQQMSDSQMPGMKTMMYIMPITFMFVLNGYSAGLTYYYFLANMFTIGQNYLFKAFVNEEDLLKKLESKKVKTKKKSKWQQRLEDMQKQQQTMAKKRK